MKILKNESWRIAIPLLICANASLLFLSCNDSGQGRAVSPEEQKLMADFDREREAARVKVEAGEGLLLRMDDTWMVVRIRSARNNDVICYQLKNGATLEATAELTSEALTIRGRTADRIGHWRDELFLKFPWSWQGVEVGVFDDAYAPTSETEAMRIPRRMLWETDAGRRMDDFNKAKIRKTIESF